jgi:glycosyltransferase involved in cell wall biosynthesis
LDTPKPLRVLQINAVYGSSSTGRTCLELDEAAAGYGVEMYSAYAVQGPFEPERRYLIGNNLDRKVHAFTSRLFGLQAYGSFIATHRLIRYISAIQPDVIHLRNLHSNYLHLGLLLRYISSKEIATVLTLHDCWFYTGRCVHYTVDNCQRWRQTCGKCIRLKKDIPSWGLDQSARMLQDKRRWFGDIKRLAVVGVSDWITQEARQSILANATIIKRIYNWIDLDVFKPDSNSRVKLAGTLGDTKGHFLIIGVATSWSDDKGLKQFIALSHCLGPDEQIVLVGNLPNGICLPENILHVKETHDICELAALYAAADVFVSFSMEETFGKVTAEALASGTPVIVNALTANPELVGPGCGYVVDTENVDGVFKAIRQVKSQGKGSYTQQCRAFSSLKFNKVENVRQYYLLYRSLTQIDGIK